jgi:hypothetical protein
LLLNPSTPIAVLGAGARLPGANGLQELWSVLAEGRCTVQDAPPPDRWRPERFLNQDPQARGCAYSFAGGYLSSAFDFDAAAFGISPREAAQMDGLGHLGFMREVAVPLVRPTLGALALFSFLSSWNQYLWPNLITTREDMNTVQTGLRLLNSSVPDIERFNVPIAGTIIAALPIAIVLAVFQRQLVRGLTAGAVKG